MGWRSQFNIQLIYLDKRKFLQQRYSVNSDRKCEDGNKAIVLSQWKYLASFQAYNSQ